MEDVYPVILSHLDWKTLLTTKEVDKIFYYFAKKEIQKRYKAFYPFGEPLAKVKIITNDIGLESISCILSGNLEIDISKENYKLPWVRNLLGSWFSYSFQKEEFIITNKLFQTIIRIVNKKGELISENRQTMIFKYVKGKTILEDIL